MAEITIASQHNFTINSIDDCHRALELGLSSGSLLITESELSSSFFDLSSRIAGELFQKFMNYGLRLAIVVADVNRYGPRMVELAREHQSHSSIRFFNDTDTALHWLRTDD